MSLLPCILASSHFPPPYTSYPQSRRGWGSHPLLDTARWAIGEGLVPSGTLIPMCSLSICNHSHHVLDPSPTSGRMTLVQSFAQPSVLRAWVVALSPCVTPRGSLCMQCRVLHHMVPYACRQKLAIRFSYGIAEMMSSYGDRPIMPPAGKRL